MHGTSKVMVRSLLSVRFLLSVPSLFEFYWNINTVTVKRSSWYSEKMQKLKERTPHFCSWSVRVFLEFTSPEKVPKFEELQGGTEQEKNFKMKLSTVDAGGFAELQNFKNWRSEHQEVFEFFLKWASFLDLLKWRTEQEKWTTDASRRPLASYSPQK